MASSIDRRAALDLSADVLVVGGGAAGIAAAITAAGQGARVTLLERYGFCGGGAVAGLSGTICGMYAATDNRGAPPRQMVHGFLDDFVAAMESRGGLTAPMRYGKTFTRVHDPLVWRDVADAMLAAAGVQVVYHTTVVGALVEGGERVEGVAAYTKQGPATVRAKVTVDASGDADVVAMAGFPSFVGQDGRVQNPTMIFRLMGVDTGRFLATYGTDTIMGEEVSALIRQHGAGNAYQLPRAKIHHDPAWRAAVQLHADHRR
jgi:2-polyprenyl-6-methoxyphenol hydroxylase-like FAD-dependent oxidoreductase